MFKSALALALIAFILGSLSACMTPNNSIVERSFKPASKEARGYLVGIMGPSADGLTVKQLRLSLYAPDTGELAATAQWKNYSIDIRDEIGPASVFVMELKPGLYEIGGFEVVYLSYVTQNSYTYEEKSCDTEYLNETDTRVVCVTRPVTEVRTQDYDRSFVVRGEINVPVRVEAGKTFYLGDFRSACRIFESEEGIIADACTLVHGYAYAASLPEVKRQLRKLPPHAIQRPDIRRAFPYIQSVSDF